MTAPSNSRPVDVPYGDAVMGDDGMMGGMGVGDRNDWTNLPDEIDFSSFLLTTSPDAVHSSQGSIRGKVSEFSVLPGMASAESTSAVSGDARSVCTQKLTSLLLDSDEICTRLSLGPGLHISQLGASDAFLDVLSAKMATRHVLESYFVLAQRLIDIYPTAISTLFTPELMTPSACDVPECLHSIDLVLVLKQVEDGVLQQGTFLGPDVAVANLLVACHSRQLDILDRLFLLVTSCTRATLASRREPDFDVSEMRIGSYVPQRTAAVLMQVALLKHIVAGLTDRLASFGRAISEWTGTSTTGDLESSILKLQHESTTKRQAAKARQVGLIEEFLLKFDFNKE